MTTKRDLERELAQREVELEVALAEIERLEGVLKDVDARVERAQRLTEQVETNIQMKLASKDATIEALVEAQHLILDRL